MFLVRTPRSACLPPACRASCAISAASQRPLKRSRMRVSWVAFTSVLPATMVRLSELRSVVISSITPCCRLMDNVQVNSGADVLQTFDVRSPLVLATTKLVYWANRCARFEFGARPLRVEVVCLRGSLIFRASGPEQHKVQNEVWLAK